MAAKVPEKTLRTSDMDPNLCVELGVSILALLAATPGPCLKGSGGSRGESYCCGHCGSVVAIQMARMDVWEVGFYCRACRGVSFAENLPEPAQPRHCRPTILAFRPGAFGVSKIIDASAPTHTMLPETSLATYMEVVRRKKVIYSDEFGIVGDARFGGWRPPGSQPNPES
jgi:hypothetical protein